MAGKKYAEALQKVDRTKQYSVQEAVGLVKELAKRKFDESVDVAIRLGVDPRKADQMVRGTVSLPHGTGKSVRVAVFAAGPAAEEAREAGADIIGAKDLADRIEKENFLDFDAAVATPDLMPVVGRLGKVLGPRGLMPNPKREKSNTASTRAPTSTCRSANRRSSRVPWPRTSRRCWTRFGALSPRPRKAATSKA